MGNAQVRPFLKYLDFRTLANEVQFQKSVLIVENTKKGRKSELDFPNLAAFFVKIAFEDARGWLERRFEHEIGGLFGANRILERKLSIELHFVAAFFRESKKKDARGPRAPQKSNEARAI